MFIVLSVVEYKTERCRDVCLQWADLLDYPEKSPFASGNAVKRETKNRAVFFQNAYITG